MEPMTASKLAYQQPHMSKFKQYGEMLEKDLEAMTSRTQKKDSKSFHWYQVKAVLQTKAIVMRDTYTAMMSPESTKKPKPILIVAPTGAGKSGIIVLLPYILESKKVLVLTPSKVISEQLRVEFGPSSRQKCFLEKTGYETDQARLQNFLEPVKMIRTADDVINPEGLGNLVIVNAQKFGGRSTTSLVHNNKEIVKDVKGFFGHFDTLIVDEAHHYPATTWERIVAEFSQPVNGKLKKIIFLTATPYRSNSAGEKTYIWELLTGGKERIAMEITPSDVEGKTTRECEFKEAEERMTYSSLAHDLDWTLADHHRRENRFNQQAMILVRTQKEATTIARELNNKIGKESFAVAVLGSECGPKRRSSSGKSPLEKFTAGEYRVAITCGVALEGYDNSKVTLCVILRKIVSGRILFTQFVGRCKRMERKLEGGDLDRTVAMVFSYPEFGQKKMWNEMDRLAELDPVEVDDDDQ